MRKVFLSALAFTLLAIGVVACNPSNDSGSTQDGTVKGEGVARMESASQAAPPDQTKQLGDAAANGDVEMVQALLRQGVDPNALGSNKYGLTALHRAAFKGHVEVIRVLLANGALIDKRSRLGTTALHAVMDGGYIDAARLLINGSANVNARDRYGLSPLHHAAASGNTTLAALLIDAQAEINAAGIHDVTPLGVALAQHKSAMAAFLRQRGGVETSSNTFSGTIKSLGPSLIINFGSTSLFLELDSGPSPMGVPIVIPPDVAVRHGLIGSAAELNATSMAELDRVDKALKRWTGRKVSVRCSILGEPPACYVADVTFRDGK